MGPVPISAGTIAQVIAENIGAAVYLSRAFLLNNLGLSNQLSMNHSYVTTKRIAPFQINDENITFRYSRAFEQADKNITGLLSEEKILLLWLALEYLREVETG